jgi:hypothetical protein
MATYQLGNFFTFEWNALPVVCKTSASVSISNESVTVRNDCTGDYGVRLEGGDKSGSFSFSGDLDFSSTGSTNLSAFDLMDDIGKVYELVFGGVDPGDKIITVDAQLNSVEITAERNSQVSFSGTFDFAGAPAITVIPT